MTWLWSCVILISPVTLALLPTGTVVGRRRPGILYVWYSFLGLAGGYIVAKLWAIARDNHLEIIDHAKDLVLFELPSYGGYFFIFANSLAGLAAGVFFSVRMMPEDSHP
jgi:hypothetical protein